MVKPGLTVLQVIPQLDAGGAERTTLEIVEALKSEGGRALVASEGGRMEEELKNLGGELFRMPASSKSPLTLHQNRGRLVRIIREEGVDLIHARSRAPAWSALWAARATNTPFVTTYHGAYGGKSAPKKLYNSVMARGDIVIANSKFIADHVKATYNVPDDRLVTIERGVDLRQFDPALLDQARLAETRAQYAGDAKTLITFPARLTSWKGQLDVIEALKYVPEALLSGLRVALIGDSQGRSDYLQSLHDLASALHLDEIIRIYGHCSDMPMLYAASDLVLAPSRRPEAFGRVAVEAQAMGVPVIASDHGGQRETVRNGETGWLVTPGEPEEIGAAIADFLSRSMDARKRMSDAAADWARGHFSTARLQRLTLNVYERLTGSPSEAQS